MTSSAPGKIIQDHMHPGWWRVEIVLRGEILTAWARSEREASDVLAGLEANGADRQRWAREKSSAKD